MILHKINFLLKILIPLLYKDFSLHILIIQFYLGMESHFACDLISWMIASTDTFEDKSNQERFSHTPNWCRLCKDKSFLESREHLLTNCPSTIHLISSFAEDIKSVSMSKYHEFCSIDSKDKWKWILGGGFLKASSSINSNPFRMSYIKSPFSKGTNVSGNINKSDPQHCLEAFFEFKLIHANLPKNCITVFTDGSVKDKKAGSGVVVYFDNKIIDKITHLLETILLHLLNSMQFMFFFRNSN